MRRYLLIILAVAAFLRFKGLSVQSFWLDELGTVNEADPSLPWKELFRLLQCCDQHPPLIYILERFAFSLFGVSETVARGVTALTGVIAVWAIYKLGKEIKDEKLGLIAAVLTCVNYYAINYSQEARSYILLFLFTSLSYLYFLRLCRNFKKTDAAYYIISTILLLYSHYFSLFVVFCQFILATFSWVTQKEKRRQLFFHLFICEAVILMCYLPWLPFLKAMNSIDNFWIPTLKPTFFLEFFAEYFDNNRLLVAGMGVMIIFYLYMVISAIKKQADSKPGSLLFSFAFVFITVFFAYLVPYVRSLTSIPMMVSRHTIIVLPSVIITVAYGILLIRQKNGVTWYLQHY